MVLMLLFAACHDNMLTPEGGGFGHNLIPKLVVTPSRLSYGEAGWGEMKQLSFEVSNEGDDGSVLFVDRIFIDGALGFRMVDDFHEFSLPKGQPPVSFTVSFSPLAPVAHDGELVVESDDDAGPQLVFMDGIGIMPELQITPNPYDFGNVNLGCDRTGMVRMKNVGNDLLTVTNVLLGNPAWSTVDPDALTFPYDLEPGEERELNLRFTPTAVASYESTLSVLSNEPIGSRAAAQFGAGLVPSAHVETFIVPDQPPVDIPIFIDPSCSMTEDQEALAANFSDFVGSIEELTTDWQIGLYNTDDGCLLTEVLKPTTLNYEQTFIDATSATRAGRETYEESGFMLLDRVLSNSGDGECNEGFLRDEAFLHSIFISDESEQTAATSGNPAYTWEYYVDKWSGMKGGLNHLMISSITGDLPDGCDSDTNYAVAGDGYVQATEATGGVWLSICNEWAESLNLLASAAFERGDFPLVDGNPDPATIEVTVNGAESSAWTYDSTTRTVSFNDGSEPTSGNEIVIRYDDATVCD